MDSVLTHGCEGWVSDFLAYMSAERACSQATVDSYSHAIGAFRTFYAGLDRTLDWDAIDEDIVRRWVVAMMEDGMAVATVRRSLSALRSFFRYLLLTKRVAHNPMTRIVSPKAVKPLPKFFRDEDINRLLDELKQDASYMGVRAYLIILMFYMTGMRVSELTGLDVEDVDMSLKQVKVTGKRNKQRVIPMSDELIDAVRQYLPMRAAHLHSRESQDDMSGVADDCGPLFLNARMGRAGKSAVEALVKDLTGTVTTQERRSPHVFRHTFATSMINDGSDLQSVKELLGHASLATTQVYTHTNFEELRRIYNDAHPRG